MFEDEDFNQPFKENGCICGKIFDMNREKTVPIADLPEDGGVFQGEAELKDDKGEKRYLEENPVFFAIKDNHVVVCSSSSSWPKDLKVFFTKLIRERDKNRKTFKVHLRNMPNKGAIEKARKANNKIKSIELIHKDQSDDLIAGNNESTLNIEMRSIIRMLFGLLKNGDGSNFDISEDDKKALTTRIKFEVNQKYSAKSLIDIIYRFAEFASNTNDVRWEINLENKKITADELKISTYRDIELSNDKKTTLRILTELSNWLKRLLREQSV